MGVKRLVNRFTGHLLSRCGGEFHFSANRDNRDSESYAAELPESAVQRPMTESLPETYDNIYDIYSIGNYIDKVSSGVWCMLRIYSGWRKNSCL